MKKAYFIIAFLLATSPIKAITSYNLITMPHVLQLDNNLCWAACCEMVLEWYEVSPSPMFYDIVNLGTGGADTTNTLFEGSVVPGYHDCKEIIFSMGGSSSYSPLNSTGVETVLSWNQISSDIQLGRPSIMCRELSYCNGHDLVLMGFDTPDSNIHYYDPALLGTYSVKGYTEFCTDSDWTETLEMTTNGPADSVPVLSNNGNLQLSGPQIVHAGESDTFSGNWINCSMPCLSWKYAIYFQANDNSYVLSQSDSIPTPNGAYSTSWLVQVTMPTQPAAGWKHLFAGDSIVYFPKVSLSAYSVWSGIWVSTSAIIAYKVLATTQVIPLHDDWNMNSFNLNPKDSSAAAVFGTGPNGGIVAQDQWGNDYWPANGYDEIGLVHVGQGYQIYTSVPDTLKVLGMPVDYAHTPIALSSGWCMIGYLPQTDDSIVHALYGIETSIDYVQDASGDIYWPAYAYDGIGIMRTGQGYQIDMNNAASLTYPTPINGVAKRVAGNGKQILHIPTPRYYASHVPTENSAILMAKKVTIAGNLVPDSSEIGAFDASGNLVGSGTVMNGITAFTIWGQNQNMKLKNGNAQANSAIQKLWGGKKDGCAIGEPLTFKVWVGSREYSINFKSDDTTKLQYAIRRSFVGELNVQNSLGKYLPGDGSGKTNGYPITKFDLTGVHPNPFKGSASIAFDVPAIAGILQHAVQINVYDLNGNLVKQVANGMYRMGHYEIAWNCGADRAAGSNVFIVRMKADNFDKQLKLVRIQ